MREGARRDGLDAFEGFTTAVLAEIPRGQGVVRLVNRGHPEPLMLYADGALTEIAPDEAALPLGMGELGTWPDRAQERAFPPGATLLLFTDASPRPGTPPASSTIRPRGCAGGSSRAPRNCWTRSPTTYGCTRTGATDDMALLAVARPAEGQPDRRRTVGLVRRVASHPTHPSHPSRSAHSSHRASGDSDRAEP